jgi:exopolyphosphatase/guanosine-5'-triphosphate,3'-diphosphate pyrophosphatase
MKKVASIDIGSNSLVLSVCTVDKSEIREIFHSSHITRLGKGLKINQLFCDESIAQSVDAIMAFQEVITQNNIDPESVFIIATEASRVAKNRSTLFDKIKEITNCFPELISGEKEAKLCLLGQKMLGASISHGILVDIGGASTEIIDAKIENTIVEETFIKSFKIGVVKLKEESLCSSIEDVLVRSFQDLPGDLFLNKKIFFSAGSMTAIASMLLNDTQIDNDSINGLCLDKDFIAFEIEKILNLSDNKIISRFPQVAPRIESIRFGAEILLFLIREKSLSEVVFTTYGLRHGIIFERLSNELKVLQ